MYCIYESLLVGSWLALRCATASVCQRLHGSSSLSGTIWVYIRRMYSYRPGSFPWPCWCWRSRSACPSGSFTADNQGKSLALGLPHCNHPPSPLGVAPRNGPLSRLSMANPAGPAHQSKRSSKVGICTLYVRKYRVRHPRTPIRRVL
jgi:hypothetical protein